MKKILIFGFLIALSLPLTGQLRINEIMVKNVSAVLDSSYNYSMWVEVYNAGATPIDISQYYFTDKKSNRKKWKPAKASVPGKGYYILWFEREEIDGHASFKLEPEGDNLYLTDETGNIIDEVNYPEQHRNISYGRISDGTGEWSFLKDFTPGESNNNKKNISQVCSRPVFTIEAGFYKESISVSFADPVAGETIYYTTNGDEPHLNSTAYISGSKIMLANTSVVRARTMAESKIPSEIITNTYFINERDFGLPVVSIVTENKNLTDDLIGIYVQGTNGKVTWYCIEGPQNYFQDWDRPANFEYFNEAGNRGISQELDIAIAGGCSRIHPQKSLKINPKKKYGNNRLNYKFFPELRSGSQYRSLLYRNSGTDFDASMMRDAFMQSLVINRMDIDCQAYQPTICFINGEYYGIQNMRERSNKDLIFSLYGLKEENIHLIDESEIGTDTEYQKMTDYVKNNDISNSTVYNQVQEMIDTDSYLDYMIAEIYFNNGDWPHNNIKMWKPIGNGKWRPILYDTDFGYDYYNLPFSLSKNAIRYALEETSDIQPRLEVNIYMFRRLMENPVFRKKFIDRFCIHLSSTFEIKRAQIMMDSIAGLITGEMPFHKQRFNSSLEEFTSSLETMRNFAAQRPAVLLGYIADYFDLNPAIQTIRINSNIQSAHYQFYEENIADAEIDLKYFHGQEIKITANPVENYKFLHWEVENGNSGKVIIPNSTFSTRLSDDIQLKAVYDDSGTSIKEPTPAEEGVFPTAVENYITIKGAKDKSLRLLDPVGKLYLQKTLYSDEENIDLSFLQKGIYIISIQDKSYKIVKY